MSLDVTEVVISDASRRAGRRAVVVVSLLLSALAVPSGVSVSSVTNPVRRRRKKVIVVLAFSATASGVAATGSFSSPSLASPPAGAGAAAAVRFDCSKAVESRRLLLLLTGPSSIGIIVVPPGTIPLGAQSFVSLGASVGPSLASGSASIIVVEGFVAAKSAEAEAAASFFGFFPPVAFAFGFFFSVVVPVAVVVAADPNFRG
jgi:hypothetical protein